MTKRAKPKRQPLQADVMELPMGPAYLMIANLLPADVEVPDWRSPDAPETAEFQKFLEEHFPRERFPKFRRMVDGPTLTQMAAREQGVEIAAGPRSRLANYRFIVETRRMWRAAAVINSLVARMAGARRSPIRICEFCRLLFIAGRNNQKTCDKKCGASLRQRRKRAKAKEYELQRELNIDEKNDRQRRLKKGNQHERR